MRRELVFWELKKLWSVPMIGIFLLLCIGLNGFLLLSNRYGAEYVSYVAEVTERIGGQMGADFDRELSALPEQEYKAALAALTEGAEDIYEEYQSEEILNIVAGMFHPDQISLSWLAAKYEKLQAAVGLLAEQDAALDLSAGEMTYDLTELLFQVLCRMMLTEEWILAVMMALCLSGSETLARTAPSVYSTRTGRGVQWAKYAASVLSGLLAYLLLCAFGLGLFCLLWDMGPLWGASMSSQMNFRLIGIVQIPFLTWQPMSIGGYLAATLLLGAVTMLIFHGLAFAAGLAICDTYKAFLVLLGAGLVLLVGAILVAAKSVTVYELLQWNPVFLWWNQYEWFTDMGVESIVPWQECRTAAACVLADALLLWGCGRYFSQKDMA